MSDEKCPNCGNRTLSERGMTVEHDGTEDHSTTWLACLNCDWEDR